MISFYLFNEMVLRKIIQNKFISLLLLIVQYYGRGHNVFFLSSFFILYYNLVKFTIRTYKTFLNQFSDGAI